MKILSLKSALLAAALSLTVAAAPSVHAQGKPGWIDPFLAYRDDFEFAPAARPVMAAFEEVRAEQSPRAQELYKQAAAAQAAGGAQGAPGAQTPPPEGGAQAAGGEKKDDVVDADFEMVDPDKKK